MKIYFSASIRQKDEFGPYYQRIVDFLEGQGHQVQHSHITGVSMTGVKAQTQEEREDHYRQVMKWINEAELAVIEASFPSTLNIGHEISLAFERGKPVIVLYKQGFDSFFLHGLKSDRFHLVEYHDDDVEMQLKSALDFAREQVDTRFNFFISPRHVNYLDEIARDRRIPRSVYLRRLIEEDMEKSDSFSN